MVRRVYELDDYFFNRYLREFLKDALRRKVDLDKILTEIRSEMSTPNPGAQPIQGEKHA